MKNSQPKKIQQVSIKSLLCRDEKVLLLKTPTQIWEMPGGRIDWGENVNQAFYREIEEEIGFKNVKLGKLINTWSFNSLRDNINHHFIIFDFEILTNEDIIRLSDEHVEYKWVSLDEFEQMDMREGHKETLRKFFKLSKDE
ncbi:NUDIX hydrolase [Candidatus Parcubacteria bacterium]|nr:NUDIX hydrolase [Candidatus Parcubacteria bacterium]